MRNWRANILIVNPKSMLLTILASVIVKNILSRKRSKIKKQCNQQVNDNDSKRQKNCETNKKLTNTKKRTWNANTSTVKED